MPIDSPATITDVPRELTMNSLGLANLARKVVATSDSIATVLLPGIRVFTLVLAEENDAPYLAGTGYLKTVVLGAQKAVTPEGVGTVRWTGPRVARPPQFVEEKMMPC